jgi:hypothetical protein
MDNFSEVSTHDLWVQARKFQLDISRPSPTTLTLTIRRPAADTSSGSTDNIVNGAVLLLGTRAITPNTYPSDGTRYINGSLVWNQSSVDTINGAQVIAFWSEILSTPFPAGTLEGTDTLVFSVTVTNTDPDTIYYASIHPCTNILQYYPIGIQSYPLEASRVEKDSSTYAGSIPSLPSAPLSPTPGMVYFDQQLNLVQYWDSTRSVWVPTRADSIISGEVNPGVTGQAYMLAGNVLKIFDGAKWVQALPSNLQLRVGLIWVPFTSVKGLIELPASPTPGDIVYSYTSQRVQYWDGSTWQIPGPSTSLFNTGASIVPAFSTPFTIEGTDQVTPYVGLLFYNISLHQLNVWNGTGWEQANTSQQGTAISDKTGIGTDGSYDERLRVINIIKNQLGYPKACVELTEEQFNIALDNALDTYRQLSIGAYEQKFIIFQLLKDQSVYHLNSPVDRTDAVVSVIKVHRMNLYGVTGSGPDNTWGQAYAQQFYNNIGGAGDLLSTHLVYSWSEEFSKIFAGDIPFTWNEARRELVLLRAIRTGEKIVLEVNLERSEQELLLDRWCKQFLQNWALAECKEYLGMIRSKYSSGTPGASGTITLNGETLLSEARQDLTELKEALLNYEYQNAEHGNYGFLCG